MTSQRSDRGSGYEGVRETAMTELPRAQCFSCGQFVPLRKNGRTRKHRRQHGYVSYECAGSGRPAGERWDDAVERLKREAARTMDALFQRRPETRPVSVNAIGYCTCGAQIRIGGPTIHMPGCRR